MFDIRMALRDSADRQVVTMLTSAAEWPLVETNEHEESAAYMTFRTWAPSSGLWLSYLEDVTTQATVLIAFGDDEDHVADLARRVSAFVEVVPRTELMAEPVSDADPQKRIPSVVRMALAAHAEFDAELFAILTEVAHDADPHVRNAAVWSTTYLEWPQSLTLLAEVADQDPDERVRQSAQDLLKDFQSSE